MSILEEQAREFAIEVHAGLCRPNKANKPCSAHLEEVAKLVKLSGGSKEEIAAAWLHDTIEDTPTTLEIISEYFGEEVESIVKGLTDPEWSVNDSIIERKRTQAERIKKESVSVKRVKLADQISNVESVAIDPPICWTWQQLHDYVVGAKLVAEECRGVNFMFDMLFRKAYLKAKEAHNL